MASRTDTIVPITLSIADVAASTSIGRTKVYAAIKSGELPTVKIGKRTLVLADDSKAWLRKHRITRKAA